MLNSQTLFMLCCTLTLHLAVDAAAFLRPAEVVAKDNTDRVQRPEELEFIAPEVANMALSPQLMEALYEQEQQQQQQQQQYRPESADVQETLQPAQKRAQTFVRFGKRAQTFVRFGKRAQTFVRFG